MRQWQCSEYGGEQDRGINAAMNIERIELDQLPRATGEVKRVESGTPCGQAMPTHSVTAALDETRTGQPACG